MASGIQPSAIILGKHKGKPIKLQKNAVGGLVVPLSQIGMLERDPTYGAGTLYGLERKEQEHGD